MRAALHPDLIAAIRDAQRRGYSMRQLAAWGGELGRSHLSQFVNGLEPVRWNDARILRLGAALGVPPSRCFVASEERHEACA